jgi:hypothetical protein
MPSVINNKSLLFSESVMRLAFQLIPAAICAIPLGAWAGASLYSGAPRTDGFAAPAAAVERSHKGNLLARPFGRGGAEIPVVEVEVNGRLDAAITLRDRDGQVLYRADPINHVTTVAKRVAPARAVPPPPVAEPATAPTAAPEPPMPDGCEGAFSPYAAPRMANVIGRCISALPQSIHLASLTR